MTEWELITGDCLEVLKGMGDQAVHCGVTSPPYYGLRDYGMSGQIGLETTLDAYAAKLVEVFREVRRVLRDDGSLWLNLGDSYAGSGKGAWANKDGGQKESYIPDPDGPEAAMNKTPNGLKPKDLMGIPWRVAFALQADGWYLRQDIIWHKPNPMPESVRDRCTKAHEYVFLFSKEKQYYYDADAIKEPAAYPGKGGAAFGHVTHDQPGSRRLTHEENMRVRGEFRNKRSVWTVTPSPFKGAHFATFPPKLVEPCILAGCPQGGTVLDPFSGSGTTGVVAVQHGRRYIGIDLNAAYNDMARQRLGGSP